MKFEHENAIKHSLCCLHDIKSYLIEYPDLFLEHENVKELIEGITEYIESFLE